MATGTGAWVTLTTRAYYGMTTYTITGLTDGVEYRFRVTPQNAYGLTSSSVVAAIPIGPAPAVVGLSASTSDSTVTLNWTPPATTGGLPVIGYLIAVEATANNNSTLAAQGFSTTSFTTLADLGSTATSYTISGLFNGGNYIFAVTPITGLNLGLLGVPATIQVATLATVASTPLLFSLNASVSATSATPGQAVLSWNPPAWPSQASGGNASGANALYVASQWEPLVMGYVLQSQAGSGPWVTIANYLPYSVANTSVYVDGLDPTQNYTFRVIPLTLAGQGAAATVTLRAVSATSAVTGPVDTERHRVAELAGTLADRRVDDPRVPGGVPSLSKCGRGLERLDRHHAGEQQHHHFRRPWVFRGECVSIPCDAGERLQRCESLCGGRCGKCAIPRPDTAGLCGEHRSGADHTELGPSCCDQCLGRDGLSNPELFDRSVGKLQCAHPQHGFGADNAGPERLHQQCPCLVPSRSAGRCGGLWGGHGGHHPDHCVLQSRRDEPDGPPCGE